MVTSEASALRTVRSIVLPGVGSFARGMRNLRERGLDVALSEQVLGQRVPFLGICLGMQLLATIGTEGGDEAGLGWIQGRVERMRAVSDERIPHVGWNEVNAVGSSSLIDASLSGNDFYFVHGYILKCSSESDVLATTPYCGGFASIVGRDNIIGVQFHPEKSQKAGFRLLTNFLAR